MLFKLLKFGLVGTTGLVIDFGLTYVLKEWLKWNKYAANAVGLRIRRDCGLNTKQEKKI